MLHLKQIALDAKFIVAQFEQRQSPGCDCCWIVCVDLGFVVWQQKQEVLEAKLFVRHREHVQSPGLTAVVAFTVVVAVELFWAFGALHPKQVRREAKLFVSQAGQTQSVGRLA